MTTYFNRKIVSHGIKATRLNVNVSWPYPDQCILLKVTRSQTSHNNQNNKIKQKILCFVNSEFGYELISHGCSP